MQQVTMCACMRAAMCTTRCRMQENSDSMCQSVSHASTMPACMHARVLVYACAVVYKELPKPLCMVEKVSVFWGVQFIVGVNRHGLSKCPQPQAWPVLADLGRGGPAQFDDFMRIGSRPDLSFCKRKHARKRRPLRA